MNDMKEEWDIRDEDRFCLRQEKDIIEDECEKMFNKIQELQQNLADIEAKFDAQSKKIWTMEANIN